MEENLHEATTQPWQPPRRVAANGCGKREGPMSSESAELAGDNLRNFSQHEEIANLGLPVDEPISTEWTNEKHSLYLNSMEASFVKQLYNQKKSSIDLLGWPSAKNILPYKNYRAGTHISSGQFKVLRDGCWQEVDSERDQPKLSTSGESHVVLESRWIRHFRSALKCQEIMSPHQKEKGALGTEPMHFRRWRRNCNGLATHSKQPLDCDTHLCREDSVSSSEEVSDQNFVNEDNEEERMNSVYRGKRMKAEVSDLSSKYQVVPSGKFP